MNEPVSGCPMSGATSEGWDHFRPFEHIGMTEFFAGKRAEQPVFWDDGLQCWIVTRRDDVREVLSNADRFSAENVHDPITPFPPELVAYLSQNRFTREKTQANCDRPKHTRIRKSAQAFLNMRNFRALEPRVRELTLVAIDQIKGKPRVDLVDDFAYELPARVIFQLLGVPEIEARQIKVWADSRFNMISGTATFEEKMEAGRQMIDFWTFCENIVAERLENPGEDYPSHLLAIHKQDPDVLSINEIKNLIFGILLAGHETTTNSIGTTMHFLLTNRDQWQQIVDDPSLIPNAVEEGLRIGPPVVAWRRKAKEDVELGGVSIPAGAPLLMSIASANRDEGHYDGPDAFDVTRENARDHVSFGYGWHFCLGAPLARLELKVVLEELTRAFPNMALVPDQDPSWQKTILVRGPGTLLVDLNEGA
ncbi:cytochrome P450 [Marivita sp. S6314]|uniref:cytochrome P450 n=1 Tax=Marivita sp. S6314 TaxID=2926406 RepID=UPI001FF192D1|nr:cytochrome P450 [Marivita sp. S6314]MCK0150873.1 cytochrome P450 [Marivita sp. S6314]